MYMPGSLLIINVKSASKQTNKKHRSIRKKKQHHLHPNWGPVFMHKIMNSTKNLQAYRNTEGFTYKWIKTKTATAIKVYHWNINICQTRLSCTSQSTLFNTSWNTDYIYFYFFWCGVCVCVCVCNINHIVELISCTFYSAGKNHLHTKIKTWNRMCECMWVHTYRNAHIHHNVTTAILPITIYDFMDIKCLFLFLIPPNKSVVFVYILSSSKWDFFYREIWVSFPQRT